MAARRCDAMMSAMEQPPPYRVAEPVGQVAPAVFSSPHSGRWYPPEFVRRARLGALALRASEDAFVDELFMAAPRFGAPLIYAIAPRAYVDLNRAPDELDPAVVEGVRATGLNPRIAAGLGVIPRVVAEGRTIYSGRISRTEAAERLARHHAPYHDAVSTLMRRAAAGRGSALLFDCHSMPSDALRAAPRVRGRRPEVVLGDRFGASAADWAMAEAQAAFESAGFVVVRNTPFAGGYITQRYGRPSQGWHAIQIELDRALYLDERRIERSAGFDALRKALEPVVARLCAAEAERRPLAAE
ncbi:MAG: N-formylglutamate amidohydrolase [Rhodobacteraceae bacterium]|nr:MAG: N-formylglutamate amidohydrolase [Paracoccaceae bacterium]